MNPTDLKQMRRKQVVAANVLMITLITIYFILTSILPITFYQLFLALGILILVQAIIGILKRDPTKSMIPIFEQVANYEKKKMGEEWKKQQRTSHIWRFVLSGMMFLQAFMHHDSTNKVFHMDISFMVYFTFFILILINLSQWMHIRKIDSSESELDLKGYTWKTNVKAILLGVVFAVIMISFTIWFMMTRI